MSAAPMSSATARKALEAREIELQKCTEAYAAADTSEAWNAVERAKSARDRAALDASIVAAREASEAREAEEAIKAKARAAFDAAAKDADPGAYCLAARPYVARIVGAMLEAEKHLSHLDALTSAQNAAAQLAADLGREIGMRAPPSVSNEERDRLLRVALEADGHGKRMAQVLEGPGVKRLRACLAYGERGMLLGQEIRRAASDRGVPSNELGLDALDVSAVEAPDWKAAELPAWRTARACMGLDAEGGAQ